MFSPDQLFEDLQNEFADIIAEFGLREHSRRADANLVELILKNERFFLRIEVELRDQELTLRIGKLFAGEVVPGRLRRPNAPDDVWELDLSTIVWAKTGKRALGIALGSYSSEDQDSMRAAAHSIADGVRTYCRAILAGDLGAWQQAVEMELTRSRPAEDWTVWQPPDKP